MSERRDFSDSVNFSLLGVAVNSQTSFGRQAFFIVAKMCSLDDRDPKT